MEDHDVVDTVQELGLERLAQGIVDLALDLCRVARCIGTGDVLAAHVRRHDDDRVLEAHDPALAIREAAIVQDLEQDVEDIRMCLLHLVEQDHAVGMTAYGFGELATFVVAHISRRSTDKTLDRELLHVLGHVDTHQRALVVEEALSQSLGQLGLADTRRAQEEEAADRPVRIRESRTAAAARRLRRPRRPRPAPRRACGARSRGS
jgi:hypothetical protein